MGHAILSPSAASRWMACTPSARLEQKFENKTSSYAEEGTLAHAVAETLLRYDNGVIDKAMHDVQMNVHRKSPYFVAELFGAALNYAEYVNEHVTVGSRIYIEQKLDMTRYIPEGFGTADAIVTNFKKKTLYFFDLKYGKGVPVRAINNSQLKIYALGALAAFDPNGEIEQVELTIYQPRLDNIDKWKTTVKELKEWAESELKEKARLAFDGKGDFTPGPHCGFCRAKAQCAALHDYNMELAKLSFQDPDLMTDDQVVQVLKQRALFVNWINAVEGYALETGLEGKQWPGFKVVEGRSNRKYSDESLVAQVLEAEGFTMAVDIYKPAQLLAMGELQKEIGKKAFEKHVTPLLLKPPGKPVLVEESDPRKSLKDPSAAFDDGFKDEQPNEFI